MRRFLTLVHKEWRDVRTLTWVSMGLVVVLAVVVRWVLREALDANWMTAADEPRFVPQFLPIVVAIYGAIAASDLVGGEVASRRMDGLALLPVGASRVWLAKATHVIVATTLFAVWAFVVQAVTVLAIDGADQAGWYLDVVRDDLWVACPVLGAALCVLFASSLGLRGISSCFVGGMVAATLIAVATLFPMLWSGDGDRGLGGVAWMAPAENAWMSALLLALPSLVASWMVVRAGRVHLARWMRPVAIGLGVFGVALAIPSAVLAYDATTLVPGRGWASVRDLEASPDGRLVAMTVLNRATVGVVVWDASTSALQVVAEGATLTPPGSVFPTNWEPDGTLRCMRVTTSGASVEELVVDPASARVVSSRTVTPAETKRRWDEVRERQSADRWVLRSQPRVGENDARLFRATLAGPDEQSVVIESRSGVVLIDGGRSVVYCPDTDRVAVRLLPDGPERVLLECEGAFASGPEDWIWLAPLHGGRTIDLRTTRRHWLIDVATAARRKLPANATNVWELSTTQGTRRLVFVQPETNDRWRLRELGAPASARDLIDLDTGATMRLGSRDPGFGEASELPDGRLVATRGERSVVILDRDLRVERVLVGEE